MWRITRNGNKGDRHLSRNNYYVNHSASRPICRLGRSDSDCTGVESINDVDETIECSETKKTVNVEKDKETLAIVECTQTPQNKLGSHVH